MKRKLLMTILTLTLALCSILGLTACGHEHSYTTSVTAPTCTGQGYTTYICSCGDSYVDDYVDAIDHDFKDYIYNNDATCTENGTETAICDRDNCDEIDTIESVGSVLGHEFINYVSNNDATETEDGTETATCDRAGCNETHKRTDVGSALGVTEYITIQTIVDQVFAGIDFDANLKESATAIVNTRAPMAKNRVNKLFSVDFNVNISGYVTFIVDSTPTSNQSNKNSITSWTANIDITQISSYLGLSKDFQGMITKMLANEELTLLTQIVKDSAQHNNILDKLGGLKTKYHQEKTLLESTAQADIKYKGLLAPAQFDSTKMQQLGITSMNDFAKALLTNYKGDGYDQVTGWTMDDVVATYVGEPTGQDNISGMSNFDVLVMLKDKVLSYNVGTQRTYGDTTDRHSMLLNDNPNIYAIFAETLFEYSSNSIVYVENGGRFN